jgi:hypothetical protein
MLDRIRFKIRPWFEKFGARLDDASALHDQIERAQADIDQAESLLDAVRFADAAAAMDLAAEIELGRDLCAAMQARLNALRSRARLDRPTQPVR